MSWLIFLTATAIERTLGTDHRSDIQISIIATSAVMHSFINSSLVTSTSTSASASSPIPEPGGEKVSILLSSSLMADS